VGACECGGFCLLFSGVGESCDRVGSTSRCADESRRLSSMVRGRCFDTLGLLGSISVKRFSDI